VPACYWQPVARIIEMPLRTIRKIIRMPIAMAAEELRPSIRSWVVSEIATTLDSTIGRNQLLNFRLDIARPIVAESRRRKPSS
jgi:hypothetical protein